MELNCKVTIRVICEYLDGRLAPGVAREVRRHLDHCSDCRMILDAARHTLDNDFGEDSQATPSRKRHVA